MRSAPTAIAAVMVGVLGSLSASVTLYQGAHAAINHSLDARLRGAGETTALMLQDAADPSARLQSVMAANQLDGAYMLNDALRVVADASAAPGNRVDLLRVDIPRVRRAMHGEESIAPTYLLGELQVASGYFPVRKNNGEIVGVLALEAGRAFSDSGKRLNQALAMSVGLAILGGAALAYLVTRANRAHRAEKLAAARAARGDALAKMAAMAAHEIRNPLGIIRGSIELLQERLGSSLDARSKTATDDVLAEVDRLRQLTEDFLDLSADRPLSLGSVNLTELLTVSSRGVASRHPETRVQLPAGNLPCVLGDPGRLHQVLFNLFSNAALAGAKTIDVTATEERGQVVINVCDDGPGVSPDVREKLFDPFVTGRADGTGLGLSLSARIVERHGGTIAWVPSDRGALFEVRLPTQGVAPWQKS